VECSHPPSDAGFRTHYVDSISTRTPSPKRGVHPPTMPSSL